MNSAPDPGAAPGTTPILPPRWLLGVRSITLDEPRLMGVLNVTPDSFADGGSYADASAAADAAERLADQGADLIDIGGESTRPGAERIPPDEQIRRVVPVVRALRARGGPLAHIPISVDTTLAEVARAALDAGADAINDVAAGHESGTLALAAERSCGLVLMHRRLPPGEDSYSDRYARPPESTDITGDVAAFLAERLAAARAAGVREEAILIDPGLGFGKSVEQNAALIAQTPRLLALGRPVLSALSRKSFVGRLSLGRDSEPGERLFGTLALSVAHLLAGARVFRVHDVGPHREALRAARAVMPSGRPENPRTRAYPGPPADR